MIRAHFESYPSHNCDQNLTNWSYLREIYPILSELPAKYLSPADDSDTDSDILEDNVDVGSSNQTADIDLPITNDNSDSLPLVDDAHVEAGIDGSIDHADTP